MTQNRSLLIGGEEVAAVDGRTTEDLNPHTGGVVARVAAAGPADVIRAVDAADAAFAGWSATAPTERRHACTFTMPRGPTRPRTTSRPLARRWRKRSQQILRIRRCGSRRRGSHTKITHTTAR